MKKIGIILLSAFCSLTFADEIDALKEQFQQQFQPLSDTVYVKNVMFSGSQMSADLIALEPLVNKIGSQSVEAARLAFVQAAVYSRRGLLDELVPLAEKALNQDKLLIPYYTNTIRADEYVLMGESLGTGKLALSIRLFQHSLALFDKGDVDWSSTVELATKSYYGFLLHEAKQFQKAKNYNLDLLKQLEEAAIQPKTHFIKLKQKILINLAQNTYELNQWDESKDYLLKRLALIEGNEGFLSDLIDCYFQLGVLAAEQGEQKTAKIYLDKMLALAEQSEYEYELKRAKERIAYWKEEYLTKDK